MDSLVQKKSCTRCKEPKLLGEFSKDSRAKDGRMARCKVCESLRLAKYYVKNKSKLSKRMKLYYKSNISHLKKKSLEYYRKNLAQIKKKHADYYERNKERMNEQSRVWAKNNPEKQSDSQHRRRARKSSIVSQKISKETLQFILDKQRNKCCYCGNKFTKTNKPTIDHLTPISLGGPHVPENLLFACKSCNSKKQSGPILCPVQPMLGLAA